MSINRETIYSALFSRLQTQLAGSFTTIGRRHVMPPDLGPAQQPALFVCGVRESHEPHPVIRTSGKLKLMAMLFVYCYDSGINEQPGQEAQLGATQMNTLLAAIDDALAPDISGFQTLGGLVYHCWVEGDTDIDPGILGQQAAAFVPVNMLVP